MTQVSGLSFSAVPVRPWDCQAEELQIDVAILGALVNMSLCPNSLPCHRSTYQNWALGA